MGENVLAILHIYWARAILLLFCEDTASESCGIEMIISQPVFARKTISKSLWDNYIHTL